MIDVISDRITTYGIEAAKYSYKIMESSFSEMQNHLDKIKDETVSDDIALFVFKSIWQFIDMSFRFGRLLAQIRGLKHRESRYCNAEHALVSIQKARNYIQHLNSQIPSVSDEIYPVLGAVSWASKDKKKSFTMALGMLPTGTSFHSLSFDTRSKEFLSDTILNIDTFSVNITACNKSMQAGFEYLTEWLDANGYTSPKDPVHNIAVVSALNLGAKTKRYLRVKFDFNKKRESKESDTDKGHEEQQSITQQGNPANRP